MNFYNLPKVQKSVILLIVLQNERKLCENSKECLSSYFEGSNQVIFDNLNVKVVISIFHYIYNITALLQANLVESMPSFIIYVLLILLLITSGICFQCPLNCKACKSVSSCDLCESGYYQCQGKCKQCSWNCLSCKNESLCLKCPPFGYYLSKGSCQICQSQCTQCLNEIGCRKCRSTDYSLRDGLCSLRQTDNTGLIVGIVIGSISLLLVAAILCCKCRCYDILITCLCLPFLPCIHLYQALKQKQISSPQWQYAEAQKKSQILFSPQTNRNFQGQRQDKWRQQACVICFLQGVNAKLQCSHAFHSDCLAKWMKRNQNCPICRHGALKPVLLYCSQCKVNHFKWAIKRIDEIIQDLLLCPKCKK